ncbi:SOS response-associated peptidase [Calothrix sp. 336/3]|uniref:SOS response-associated peptidase n=1 Tax=Calothrix sp. 336/3 TaxID=1337936 RepID=UPI0004E445C1|nr:SOS response-associated peptidase [Calothrix sp. 336/3]AKG20395.1 hypothetical protein IJ00_02825 [Calothrix sp. 336/3]
MCGRFTLSVSPVTISQVLGIAKTVNFTPQYNIAPTQMLLAIVYNLDNNQREFKYLRWGLIPAWAKDRTIGTRLINARGETLTEKPSFRTAFQRRRCLVVADGFYEWQAGTKQPYYFHLSGQQPFAFAGLWEKWTSPTQEEVFSCTIVTTEANELLKPVHHRMPVIIPPEDYSLWLDPQITSLETLQSLLQPYPTSEMIAYPVSKLVNSPKHNSADCIAPLGTEN